jgi:hypothetical protein
MNDFETFDNATYCFWTGCGKLYVTVLSKEGSLVKVIANRKSRYHCDITFFDALNRSASFASARELEQVIEDLRGFEHGKDAHKCVNNNITVKAKEKQGFLTALSCADAVSRALEKEVERLGT